MKETELTLYLPCDKPLKKEDKNMLISELTLEFNSLGIRDLVVKDSFYETERAMPETMQLVFVILTATANIATIAMAVRNFLEKRKESIDIRLETKSLRLTINGKMSNGDILTLVEKAGKIIEKEKEK